MIRSLRICRGRSECTCSIRSLCVRAAVAAVTDWADRMSLGWIEDVVKDGKVVLQGMTAAVNGSAE